MQFFFTLLAGLLLGLQHAFEPDHVVAVSTITVEQKTRRDATLVGVLWGLGHATSIVALGFLVFILQMRMPEQANIMFDVLIGCMLIFLGLRVIFRQRHIHMHAHTHDGSEHMHVHSHTRNTPEHDHHTSFIVGCIHGLAGSGLITILILATVHNIIEGILYSIIFSAGSLIGMVLLTTLLYFPVQYFPKRIPSILRYVQITAGCASIILGALIIYATARLLIR